MKLKLALAAFAIAGSAQAQGFEFNQAELSFDHSRLFAAGTSAETHHYGGRADFAVAKDYGVQLDLANTSRGSTNTLWTGTVHGYARRGDTKFGAFIGSGMIDGDVGNLAYGGEVMLKFGEKLDVEGRLMRREIGAGSSPAAYDVSTTAWYDINSQLTVNGSLGFATINDGGDNFGRYTVGLGVEYELQRAPIALYAGVDHSIYDGIVGLDGITEARIGMSFSFGKPERRKDDRMFSDLRRTGLF